VVKRTVDLKEGLQGCNAFYPNRCNLNPEDKKQSTKAGEKGLLKEPPPPPAVPTRMPKAVVSRSEW